MNESLFGVRECERPANPHTLSMDVTRAFQEAMARHGLFGQERELLKELEVKELELRKEISALSARLRIAHCRQQERRTAHAHRQQVSGRCGELQSSELRARNPPGAERRAKQDDDDDDDDDDYYRTDLNDVGLSNEDAASTLKVLDLMSGLGMDVPERLLSKLRVDQLSREDA